MHMYVCIYIYLHCIERQASPHPKPGAEHSCIVRPCDRPGSGDVGRQWLCGARLAVPFPYRNMYCYIFVRIKPKRILKLSLLLWF